MNVNGTKYESDADVILKADLLRNAWEKTLDAIHDDRQMRTGLCTGLSPWLGLFSTHWVRLNTFLGGTNTPHPSAVLHLTV